MSFYLERVKSKREYPPLSIALFCFQAAYFVAVAITSAQKKRPGSSEPLSYFYRLIDGKSCTGKAGDCGCNIDTARYTC